MIQVDNVFSMANDPVESIFSGPYGFAALTGTFHIEVRKKLEIGRSTATGGTDSAFSTVSDSLFGLSRTSIQINGTDSFYRNYSVSIVSVNSQTVATFDNNGVVVFSTATNEAQSFNIFSSLVNGRRGYEFFYSSATKSVSLARITMTNTATLVRPFTSQITDDSADPKFALTFTMQVPRSTSTSPTTTQLTFGIQACGCRGQVAKHSLKSFQGIQLLRRNNAGTNQSSNVNRFSQITTTLLSPSFDSWDPYFDRNDFPMVRTRARTSPNDYGGIYTLSLGETITVDPYDNITVDALNTISRTNNTTFRGGGVNVTRAYPISYPVNYPTATNTYGLLNGTTLDGTIIRNGGFHPIYGSIDIEDPNGVISSVAAIINTAGFSPIRSWTYGESNSRVQYDDRLFEQLSPIKSRAFLARNLVSNGYVVPTFSKFFVGTGGTKVQYGSTLATEIYASSLNSAFSGIAGFITFQQSIGGTIFSLKTGITTEVRQAFYDAQTSIATETFSQETGIPTDSTDITTGRITKTYRTWNSTRAINTSLSQQRTVIGSFTLSLSTMDISNLSSRLTITSPPNQARSNTTAPVLNANLHNISSFGSAINARTYSGEFGNDPNDLFTYRKFRNIGSVSTSAYYGYAAGYLEYDTTTLLRSLDYLSPMAGSTNWKLVGGAMMYQPYQNNVGL
jgi:hypothetical protein